MCGFAKDNTVYKIDAGTGARMRTYIATLIHACVLDHIFNLENPFSYIILKNNPHKCTDATSTTC